MSCILIVDDEPAICEVLRIFLSREGFEVVLASGLAELRERIIQRRYEAVLTDHLMNGATSHDILKACRAVDPVLPVLVMTAFATSDLALEVLEHGAYDFITKPFVPIAVIAAVRRAADFAMLSRENQRLRSELEKIRPSSG